jgi:hypothetical protein
MGRVMTTPPEYDNYSTGEAMRDGLEVNKTSPAHRASPFRCDAFGDIGTIFREVQCKKPIFSEKVVPKNPNAS